MGQLVPECSDPAHVLGDAPVLLGVLFLDDALQRSGSSGERHVLEKGFAERVAPLVPGSRPGRITAVRPVTRSVGSSPRRWSGVRSARRGLAGRGRCRRRLLRQMRRDPMRGWWRIRPWVDRLWVGLRLGSARTPHVRVHRWAAHEAALGRCRFGAVGRRRSSGGQSLPCERRVPGLLATGGKDGNQVDVFGEALDQVVGLGQARSSLEHD